MKSALILVAFLICAFNARAEESLNELFYESWNTDYQPLTCSDNIIRLFKSLGKPKHSLVLHIFHKWVPHKPVLPQKPRLSSPYTMPVRWTFHAVLLVEDVVFDLDFKKTPTPLKIDDYFKAMWEAGALENDYRFQLKSAKDYTLFDADGDMAGVEKLSYLKLTEFLLNQSQIEADLEFSKKLNF